MLSLVTGRHMLGLFRRLCPGPPSLDPVSVLETYVCSSPRLKSAEAGRKHKIMFDVVRNNSPVYG